jgi:predicted CoA-substrate-specific enzyme activase
VSDAPRLFCGVDVGASATKLVLVCDGGEVLSRVVLPTGVDFAAIAGTCRERALEEIGGAPEQVVRTVATGYGRRNVPFADAAQTEIHCHGVGCFSLLQRAMAVVDIGGQDNKVIRLGADGRRIDFAMNRKCAAGTGAFIEEIALRLGLNVADMEALAHGTDEAVRLSSFCTVFAKTEILAHLRRGASVESIVRGAFLSVVNRVMEMDPLDGEVVLTGGVVAHNPTIGEILSARLSRPVVVPPFPQFTGALGAALLASTDKEAAARQRPA